MRRHTLRTIALLLLALFPVALALPADDKTAPAPPPVAKSPASPPPSVVKPAGPEHEVTNSIGMKLVLIRAGNFMMGSPDSDKDAQREEKPQHRVQIMKPFYLGKYEVTQGEWNAVMGTEPWKGKSSVKEGDDYPATYVSWDDAIDFCKKLSSNEGKMYRLPTEAEWEFACRGGKSNRFHFGNDDGDLGEFAWFDKNAWDVGDKFAHRVGQKKSNLFGLHDMHGNVREWCRDWYSDDYYAKSSTINPQGPNGGSARVIRGGGWFNRSVHCRSSDRGGSPPSGRDDYLGFRVARDR